MAGRYLLDMIMVLYLKVYPECRLGYLPESFSSRLDVLGKFGVSILDQIFLCDPVVLESICYRTRAKRLINDSKTTRELRKIWTGT